MNRDVGSYQLSHIYDNPFAPNLSGERRLDTDRSEEGLRRGRNVNFNLKKVVFLIEYYLMSHIVLYCISVTVLSMVS